jgi:predicted nuclease of predicted toxin-antitoxin system
MRLLLDMNMSALWMPVLAAHGQDVVHWSTVGDAMAPNPAVMRWAASEARVISTHDLT